MPGDATRASDDDPFVEIRILDERVATWGLPRYRTEMSAAMDLYACVDAEIALEPEGRAELIPSGVAIHIGRRDLAGLIVPRSGLGHARGLVLGNLVGVLDADYTGPLMISAWNRNAAGTEPIVVRPGDRIAQLLFVPIARPEFRVVTAFSTETARAAGGFGSTGASVRGDV